MDAVIKFIEVVLKKSKKQQSLKFNILFATLCSGAGIICGTSIWLGNKNPPLVAVIIPLSYGILALFFVFNYVIQLIMLQISNHYDKDYFCAINCFEASTTESLEDWKAEKKPCKLDDDDINLKTNTFLEEVKFFCPLVKIIKKTEKYKKLSKKAHHYQCNTILSSLFTEHSENYPLYDDINEIITDYCLGNNKSSSIHLSLN